MQLGMATEAVALQRIGRSAIRLMLGLVLAIVIVIDLRVLQLPAPNAQRPTSNVQRPMEECGNT
ncbi:MAG: hypothetical protein QOI34_1699 [Verrucomicrobiota bacterium]|jgi:hypothetical protein